MLNNLVGTPMYVAPEMVLMQPLDGRADLYSLGVVLYRLLAKRYPYRGGSARSLREAWRIPPPSPCEVCEHVPRPLSDLAMSLIALNRDVRPRDASEVMDRLAAIAELERRETADVSRAYLVTPTLVGRSDLLRRIREVLVGAVRGRGGALLLSGPPGVGRTRMLDAAVLEAKVLGATVLRVGAPRGGQREFVAMETLLEQLKATDPEHVERELATLLGTPGSERVELARTGKTRTELINALRDLFVRLSSRLPIVIAADDLHLVDEPSVAAMASMLQDTRMARLVWLGTVPEMTEEPHLSMRLLAERSEAHVLLALEQRATQSLVRSMFGAVPHVDRVADQIHRLSRGYPRDAVTLAEHLVERGVVAYRAGAFSLPEHLAPEQLPATLSAALAERVSRLAGQSSVVGVAALACEETDTLPTAVQALANAFGDFLVRSGDSVLTDHAPTSSDQTK